MANQIIIDIGAVANDGTGDPLRTAFGYVNNNFSNIWATGVANSNISFSGNKILTTNTNGNLVLAPNGIGKVQANVDIVPNANNTVSLGSLTRQWNTVYAQNLSVDGNVEFNDLTVNGNLTVTGNTIQIGNIVTDTKTIQLANTASTANAANGSGITVGANDNIATLLYNSASNVWTTNIGLTVTGNLTTSTGTVSSNNINFTNNLYGKTGTFTGDVRGDNSIYAGVPLFTSLGSDVIAQFSGNVNAYTQFNFQNGNTGAQASGDYVITADNGNDSTHFINLGITSSGWNGTQPNSLGNRLGPNDGYLYVQDGDMVIGTSNGNIETWKFDQTGNLTVPGDIIPVANNTQSLGSATNQWNDLYISNATIFMNSVPITLGAGNVLTVNGEPVLINDSNTSITTTGNITADYFFGNGSQLTGLSTSSISNGTSNVEIAAINGNITITANTQTWTFGTDGTTIFPTLTVTRGDRTGTLTGQALLFGDITQEAIISTLNGNADIPNSQRLVINPGAGAPGTTGEGGDIYLYAGRGGDAGGSGGDIKIRGGLGPVNGAGGYITMEGGEADVNGVGGYIEIYGGVSGNSNGGYLDLRGGVGQTEGGAVFIQGGQGQAGPGGPVNITGGVSGLGLAEYGNVGVIAGTSGWVFDNTGNLTLPDNGNINGADGQFVRFQSVDEGIVRSGVILNPGDGLARLESWDNGSSQGFTSADWTSATYVADEGGGYIAFIDAPNILNLANSIEVSRLELQVNGGAFMPYQGFNTSGNNITFFVTTAPVSSPETVIDFTMAWADRSRMEMDYDEGELNIQAQGLDLTINGNQDVDILSSDRIRIENSSTVNGITISTDTANTFRTWTFDIAGNLTLPQSGVVYETNIPYGGLSGKTIALAPAGGTSADQQLLIYPTAGADANHLHLTTGNLYNTELFLGNDDLYVKLANTGAVVINSNDGVGNTAQWTFDTQGTILNSGNLTLQTPSGIPTSLSNWQGQGGWNQALYSNVATTGGTGTGLTVNVAAAGAGYISINDITINTPGTGYTNGDVITIDNENNLPGTFTVGVVVNDWIFGTDGALTFPDGANIVNGAFNGTASSTVSLNAFSPDGNTVSFQAQGNTSSAVISIFSNAGPVTSNWTFTTAPLDPSESFLYVPNGGAISTPDATGGEGGKNIFIQAGASDPVTWNSNPGGELFIKGGYGSFGDGGGGPGGNVNIEGGPSSDSHAGNVNITCGSNSWVFDYSGNVTIPGNINAVMSSPAPSLNGFTSVNAVNVNASGNISGNIAGYAIGYRDIPQVSFTGNATIATTDAGKHFYSTQSSNYILTIANNASQGFQVGAAITVVNQGTGTITIAQGSGVILYLAGNATSGNRSVSTFGMATIMKVATDTWFINGTGVS